MARNRASRGIRVSNIATRIGNGLRAGAAGAAVNVTDLNSALLVNSHVEKVEQVTADVRAAAIPDATALDRRVRRRVNCSPGLAAVEGLGNVKMPDAVETIEAISRAISRCGRAIKRDGRSARAAGHCCGIGGRLYAEGCADVESVLPSLATVG